MANETKVCPVCGSQVLGLSEEEKDKPLKRLEKCSKCKRWNLILNVAAVVASLVAFIIGFVFRFNMRGWIGLVGLILGIKGAFLLGTGYERVLSCIGLWGAYKVVEKRLPSLTRRVRWGVLLLLLGFLLQAIYIAK